MTFENGNTPLSEHTPLSCVAKVYIILVNYCGWKDTIDCIESLMLLDYSHYQIIVIDNESPDGSLEKLIAWAQDRSNLDLDVEEIARANTKIPFVSYSRTEAESGGRTTLNAAITSLSNACYVIPEPIVFIEAGSNVGFAAGNNIAIKYALKRNDFGYLWLLNNDTIIARDALSELVKTAQKDASIGMVGSKLLKFYENNIVQTLGGNNNVSWRSLGEEIHPSEKNDSAFNTDFEINGYICGASILVHKNVIDSVGLLDENYFMWSEEADWCVRVVRAGWKMYYCGSSTVWHKIGGATGRTLGQKILWKQRSVYSLKRFVVVGYYDIRNRLYFCKKHFNGYFYAVIILVVISIFRKIISILLFDDRKLVRCGLLLRGFVDGITGKYGKRIDPAEY